MSYCVDGSHRQTNRVTTGHHLRKLSDSEGSNYQGWWRRCCDQCHHPERTLHFYATTANGLCSHPGNRWAADEEDGRLEMVLATPQPRLNVLLARFAALTTVLVIMGILTLAATELAALAAGLKLDGGNVAAATLSMIPMGLLIAALGFLFSGWLRTAIDTGLLSFLLVIWFFITFVGPELNWPEGVQKLLAFYYYGTPLLHGLSLGNMLLVLVVAVVALALASVRFMRKDIGR